MYRNAAPKFIHPCRKDTDGKLRYKNGAIEEGGWLVIGKEGVLGVALWYDKGKRIIHTPEEAEFLRVKLRVTKERWDTMKLTGWAKTSEREGRIKNPREEFGFLRVKLRGIKEIGF